MDDNSTIERGIYENKYFHKLGGFEILAQEYEILQKMKDDLSVSSILKKLTTGRLVKEKNDIWFLRFEDVFTVLEWIQRGRISIRAPDDFYHLNISAIAKGQAGFYLVYLNNPDNLYDVAFGNSYYGEDWSFVAATMRFISPWLVDNWIDKVRSDLRNNEVNFNLFEELQNASEVAENFLDALNDSLSEAVIRHKRLNTPERPVSIFEVVSRQMEQDNDRVLKTFKSIIRLPPGVKFEQVVNFLINIRRTRKGVILGFNREIIQGKVCAEPPIIKSLQERLPAVSQFQEIISDGENEVVVGTNLERLSLNRESYPIVAMEPLGDFEEIVLDEIKGAQI